MSSALEKKNMVNIKRRPILISFVNSWKKEKLEKQKK